MSSFANWSRQAAELLGSPYAFLVAALVVVVWLISGPVFDYSDTWQLIINTGTTIVTFLMVFLIQNTQNRDARATQLKLDEIIKATSTARNKLIDLEHCTDQELDHLQRQFERLRHREDGAA
jgi:low affinity Fe/Cu permease